MVTTSERCVVWTFGYPDEGDEQLGYLEEGETVLFLGEKVFWRDDQSFHSGGHFIYRVLTRLGIGWINDVELDGIPT